MLLEGLLAREAQVFVGRHPHQDTRTDDTNTPIL